MKMRGQTAVEYLMTYGWAILIILIVAGVLAYYGIFAPAGFLGPTARGFGQVQVLTPWSLATTGTFTINVENRVGGTINVTQLNATLTSGGTGTYNDTISPPVTITSGQQEIVQGTFTGIGTPSTGDSWTATLTIYYEYPPGGATFSSTGTLSGTYS
jgi:hypothetical protein